MKRLLLFAVLCSFFALHAPVFSQEVLGLAGAWELSVGDSLHYGDDYVMLPGPKPAAAQKGELWYRRGVYVPGSWTDKRISLFLERPQTETTVIVNGVKVLHQPSAFTPHECDITRYVRLGERNQITVRTSGGIAGRMELRTQPKRLYIEKVRLQPNPFQGVVQVYVELSDNTSYFDYNTMEVYIQQADKDSANLYVANYDVTSTHMLVSVPIGHVVALWDEFHPHLYRIGIDLGDDYYETTFGMREIGVKEHQVHLNRSPLLLRGIEEAPLPATGLPPAEEATWLRIFRQAKERGLNHMRFSSYCPPEAAFSAADKLGFYLNVDVGASEEQLQRMADVYGAHPSFLMLPDSLCQMVAIPDCQSLGLDGGQALDYYKKQVEASHAASVGIGFLLPAAVTTAVGQARDWQAFCSPIVALAHFPKTDYSSRDTLSVPVEVYNAMYGELSNVRVNYYLYGDSGQVYTGGQLYVGNIPVSRHVPVGTISFPLDAVKHREKLTLMVTVGSRRYTNYWHFQVSPEYASDPNEKERQ